MGNNIIIFSEPYDHTTNDVLDWLYYQRCKVFRINPNDDIQLRHIEMKDGKQEFNLTFDGINELTIANDSKVATWYRRGKLIFKYPICLTPYFNRNINEEKSILEDYLELFLRKDTFINKARDNDINKMEALYLATEAGLETPATIIATSKAQLIPFMSRYEQCITKMISEIGSTIYEYERNVEFHTKTILVSIDEITEDETFLPSLFQQYIPKEYEIRSFYLNGLFIGSFQLKILL